MKQKEDGLSLENLAMPVCFSDPKALAEIPRIDLDEPGLTDEEIAAICPKCDYDQDMKTINTCIYDGRLYSGTGFSVAKMQKRQVERLKLLFGLSDNAACLDWFRTHGRGDSDVSEILIADAVGSGKWQELPDELQPLYLSRIGASV